jgi:hypothetical protein
MITKANRNTIVESLTALEIAEWLTKHPDKVVISGQGDVIHKTIFIQENDSLLIVTKHHDA